jgi:hypothetical protein
VKTEFSVTAPEAPGGVRQLAAILRGAGLAAVFLGALAPFSVRGAQADERASIDRAATSAKADLDGALKRLAEVREQIAAEKPGVAKEFPDECPLMIIQP